MMNGTQTWSGLAWAMIDWGEAHVVVAEEVMPPLLQNEDSTFPHIPAIRFKYSATHLLRIGQPWSSSYNQVYKEEAIGGEKRA